jgi:hypothetical protein
MPLHHALGHRVLGRRVLGRRVLGRRVLGRRVLGRRVLGRRVLGRLVEERCVLGPLVEERCALGRQVEERCALGRQVEERQVATLEVTGEYELTLHSNQISWPASPHSMHSGVHPCRLEPSIHASCTVVSVVVLTVVPLLLEVTTVVKLKAMAPGPRFP